MSSTGHTSRGGRPTPAVYRRRRVVALVVLALLIAGIVWAVMAVASRLGGEATAEPAAEATEAAAADGEAGGAGDESAGAGDESPAACRSADVDVELGLDPPAPTAGSGVDLDLRLLNSGDEPCLLDAGPASLVATVTSGNDTVWTTAHCADDAEEQLLLDAGTEHAATVSWPGTRSATGCGDDQPAAGPGSYRVTVGLGGETTAADESATFTIGPAAEPSGEPEDDQA
ncbi:hypothetical protein [Georgenia sunbinii]|uniref:hypothetical protein n=1 Tax=Georgenia sunbinii TaxID=3117728 RepID=UPI002F26253D